MAKRIELHPTSTNKVLSLLNRLNKSKAAGLDKISARLIRECADLICIPIRDIFNQSISQGIFPDDWKCAKVTPLFKQGDRDDLNNYRPISVISVMAKVFERIVYDQLYAYLEEHNIICKYQSGASCSKPDLANPGLTRTLIRAYLLTHTNSSKRFLSFSFALNFSLP